MKSRRTTRYRNRLSLTAIVAPLISTGLFAHFTRPNAPVHLPGAPFFAGSAFMLGALGVATWALSGAPPPLVDGDLPFEVGPPSAES